ncbi:uncharacterized protein LOC124491462 [Dermatophagoides farinae]|nr:uncharacterized protein LOC124491462 [Dermatophagoides farinae]KAH9528783.1 hypothetical protein DERF_002697 [Dermatophagoides farinae]
MATVTKSKKMLRANITENILSPPHDSQPNPNDNPSTSNPSTSNPSTSNPSSEQPVVIISDCEEEMDDTSNDTTTQQEVPLSASSSRSTRPKRTPRNTVDSPSVTNSLTNYLDRPRYTTDADAKFIKSVHVAVGGLSGNITREIKRDTLIALSIADSMYSEIVLLRKRLMTATKRKSAVLDQDDDEIMDIGNMDNDVTGSNIREEMNEMKLAINKLTALVQNNINLATTTPQRPAPQQQLQKTFSEVIKQHSANKTPIHRTIVSIPGNENSEATQQMLTTKIVPVNEGINIVESRKLSKGKVAIDFTSPESQQKFEDKVAATPELVHETPRILYPMMIIKGAPARIEKEQLPNMIKPFNHLISEFINKNNLKIEQEIEPVYARQNRKPGLRNFAIRVNPKLRDIIVDKMHNKIIIDYQTTHIEDMTPVMQCYKCYGYNHKISECQVPDQMCLHCGDFHSFNQCPRKSSPAICLNCIRSNITNATSHNSVNRECPVHIRLLSRVINKIQY